MAEPIFKQVLGKHLGRIIDDYSLHRRRTFSDHYHSIQYSAGQSDYRLCRHKSTSYSSSLSDLLCVGLCKINLLTSSSLTLQQFSAKLTIFRCDTERSFSYSVDSIQSVRF